MVVLIRQNITAKLYTVYIFLKRITVLEVLRRFVFFFLYCYNVSPIQTTRQLNVNLHYLDLQMVAVSRDIFPFFPLIDLKMSSGDQSEGLMFEMNSAKGKKSSLKVATPGDENVATLEMH